MAATNGALQAHSRREAELEATVSIVQTYGRYAQASRALTFVNEGPPILGSTHDHFLRRRRNGDRDD
jgi:hypothetical protein